MKPSEHWTKKEWVIAIIKERGDCGEIKGRGSCKSCPWQPMKYICVKEYVEDFVNYKMRYERAIKWMLRYYGKGILTEELL